MAILKDLIVHGSSRFLNKIYANELETPLINADEARFTKLIAKDASLEDVTVTGLLDVQGQLHTNTWTNSNISTIEGSFYIMPTLSNMTDSDSNVLTFIASTLNSYPIVSVQIGSNQAFAGMGSLQFEAVAGVQNDTTGWTGGSKVLLTGEVKVGSEWLPLGTIVGTLNSFNNDYSSIEIVDLKDNKGRRPAPILLNFPLSSQIRYRNLKISLCERYISGNGKYYPIGIYMTALGSNGKTFLDIYGGGQEANVDNAGGLARPNVRIGNLNGLPSIGSQVPHGWGIYTTHGYFSGTVVADTGNIGGWNLTANSIWKGNQTFKNSEGMYFGSAGISLGSTFSVSNSGVLAATSGHIGGWVLTQDKLSIGELGEINSAVINPGTTLEEAREIGGSEELSNWIFTAGANFGVTGDGTLYANNANITGTINATEGNIGGIEIVDGRLQGENFGIEENGDIYINNANVTGTIIATSGNIGGIEIDENGKLNLSSLSIGDFKDANEYAQKNELQLSKKITTYYLASSKSSDVVFEDEGWSLATPTVDENKKYLWAYQVRKGKENHDEGSIISFENDGDSILFDNLIVDIDPVQSGSGDPSPDNVRPISGWTGVTVQRTGKNLLSTQLYDGADYNSNIGTTFTLTPSVEHLTDEGSGVFTLSIASSWKHYAMLAPIKNNGQHIRFSGTLSSTGQDGYSAYLLDENYTVLAKVIGNAVPATINADFDLSQYTAAAYGLLEITNRGTANATLTLTKPMVEYNPTATAYEPYNGNTYSVDWQSEAGTVYGGTLDIVSGVLTVDRAIITADDVQWSLVSSNRWGANGLAAAYRPSDSQIAPGLIAEKYKSATNVQLVGGQEYSVAIAANGALLVKNGSTTDKPTGQICYKLATPITYQLTPTEVKSLLGQNHVWADCGDVELTYSTNAVRGNPYLIGMEDVNGAVNSLQTDVNDLSSTVNDYLGEEAWITLDTQKDDNGNNIPIMRLGSSSSDPLSPKIQAVLTNEKLDFRVNNNSVAYIAVDTDDNNIGKLYATNSFVTNEVQFGNWAWYQRKENGHLSVKWKGGNNS